MAGLLRGIRKRFLQAKEGRLSCLQQQIPLIRVCSLSFFSRIRGTVAAESFHSPDTSALGKGWEAWGKIYGNVFPAARLGPSRARATEGGAGRARCDEGMGIDSEMRGSPSLYEKCWA